MNATTASRDGGMAAMGRRLWARLRFFGDDLLIAAVVLLVLLVFLLPSMVVTIPAGHLGVHWKRFGGGTDIDSVRSEGTTLIPPWDILYIYDARLQSVDREYEVLASDGLKLQVTLAWRFRLVPEFLGELHRYIGSDYTETLVGQSIGARARDVIAIYRPEDIYTSHRLEIQNQISESVRYDIRHRFNTELRSGQEWVLIEDVLIKRIVLPDGVEDAIVRKNVTRHEVEQYALMVEKEGQESERKRVEALGIRNFQEIISGGMNDAYLRWRGIEATLELARSENAKVVIMGNDKTGGLPLISIGGEGLKPEGKTAGKPVAGTSRGDASTPADAVAGPLVRDARPASSAVPRPTVPDTHRRETARPEAIPAPAAAPSPSPPPSTQRDGIAAAR